jgi:hypothetical protein
MAKGKEKEFKTSGQGKNSSGIFISFADMRRSATWILSLASRNSLVSILVAIIVGGAGGYAIHSNSPKGDVPHSVDVAAADTSVQIASPSPGESVARCTASSGSANIPMGGSVWILVQASDAGVYYIEGRAAIYQTSGSNVVDWNYETTIGSVNSSAQYSVVAVAVDAAMNEFLSGMLDAKYLKGNPDGLANASLPPGLLAEAKSTVTRISAENAECA